MLDNNLQKQVICSTTPPSSAVSMWTGYIGLLGIFVGAILVYFIRPNTISAWSIFMSSGLFPMMLIEYYRNRYWQSQAQAPISCTRLQVLGWKLRGGLCITLLWIITLSVFDFAGVYVSSTIITLLPWFGPVLAVYIVYYLLRNNPVDWEKGTLLSLGYALERQGYSWSVWKDTIRNHFVKAFFLPLMIEFSYRWVVILYDDFEYNLWIGWYFLPITLLYLIDTVFGTIGYLCNSRRLDTHIRSSNPYLLAWLVALLCYPPLIYLRRKLGLSSYALDDQWWRWFDMGSLYFYIWGSVILFLTAIYAWATIIFGLRFSNLTNRGIITNGPYRYFKHPAYWSKNLSWWFIFAPFLREIPLWLTMQMVAGLLLTNLIYWCRAKTEEWHLMQDPKYQEYSLWIEKYGVWGRVKSLFKRKKN